jgi:hypothetical protein
MSDPADHVDSQTPFLCRIVFGCGTSTREIRAEACRLDRCGGIFRLPQHAEVADLLESGELLVAIDLPRREGFSVRQLQFRASIRHATRTSGAGSWIGLSFRGAAIHSLGTG